MRLSEHLAAEPGIPLDQAAFERSHALLCQEQPNASCRESLIPYIARTHADRRARAAITRRATLIESRRMAGLRRPGYKDLLQTIYSRNTILFVGAGLSLDFAPDGTLRHGLTGAYAREQLLIELRNKVGPRAGRSSRRDPESALEHLTLAQAALAHQRTFSRPRMEDKLLSLCREKFPTQPLGHHRVLAQLNCFPYIITTNWDRLLEQAFEDSAGQSRLNIVTRGADLPRIRLGRPTLVKLHGDYDSAAHAWTVPPSITEEDIFSLEQRDPALFNFLQTLFISYRIVVVGFYPRDYNLVRLLHFAAASIPGAPKPLYIVDPDKAVAMAVPLQNPEHFDLSAAEFLSTLRDFTGLQGGATGQAFRNPRRHVGAPLVWCKPNCKLATDILKAFEPLQRVEVVSNLPVRESGSAPIPARAAHVLAESLKPNGHVGLSCGTTLRSVVDYVDTTRPQLDSLKVSSTTVLLSDESSDISPFALVTTLSHRLAGRHATGAALQLPACMADLVASTEIAPWLDGPPGPRRDEAVRNQTRSLVSEYLERTLAADAFFMGVGVARQQRSALHRYARACARLVNVGRGLSESDIDRWVIERWRRLVKEYDIGGDLMFRLFRSWPARGGTSTGIGAFIDDAECAVIARRIERDIDRETASWFIRLHAHAISVELSRLRDIVASRRRVVCLIAQGQDKAMAVKRVLLAGLANTIVVDDELARRLLP